MQEKAGYGNKGKKEEMAMKRWVWIVAVAAFIFPALAFGNPLEEDFAWAMRGFIAPAQAGAPDGWEPEEGKTDTVNPSLLRQARLNNIRGLFQVAERVYQVRGYDLANMGIILGDRGYIVIDPLSSVDTAKAAIELVYEKLGKKPIMGIIYSHSHVDHWGGVRGVVEPRACPIIAPKGFMREAIRENIYAGNAMARRASYMYGSFLPIGQKGRVDEGLGKALPQALKLSLLPPTREILSTGEEVELDGVKMIFQLASGAEAPANMHIYFPQFKALFLADDCVATLHNLLTPRGAQVRDARAWSRFLEEAIELFGEKTEVVFLGHTWPRWGREKIITFMRKQADVYRYLHDQTLRLINNGYTMGEINEIITLPPELAGEWYNRPYYATVGWNARAVYQFYLGWFDGNPVHLNPLPEVEAAKRYISYMGGSEKVLEKAKEDLKRGEFRWVAEVTHRVVLADPENEAARLLLAQALERMGYEAESAVFRNFYLSGAHELRHGIKDSGEKRRLPLQVCDALSLEDIFEGLAIRLNGPRAAGKKMVINWQFPDTGEKVSLLLENGVLHHFVGKEAKEAECTIRLNRNTFNRILSGETWFVLQLFLGRISLEGNSRRFWEFMDLFDEFNPFFSIMTTEGRMR